tara:strand:- start:805 stop:1197 length:393 start_codon:yes stop_codon:yes gene_type:complete
MIVVRRRQTNEIGASFRRCETVRNAARCSSFRRKSHATNNTFTVATVDDSFCVFQPHRRRRLNRHHREEKSGAFRAKLEFFITIRRCCAASFSSSLTSPPPSFDDDDDRRHVVLIKTVKIGIVVFLFFSV